MATARKKRKVGTKVTDDAKASAVGTIEVEALDLAEEVEFDDSRDETALYRRVTATVETLYRQKGQFFLFKEYAFAWGEDASIEDCCTEEYDSERLSPAEAEVWLEHYCGERDEVTERVAELDKQDGVVK
jgi:hypothetical protein